MEETVTRGATELPPIAPPPPDGLAAIVERWWDDHFPGSPVAQVTQAWNHAFAAKEELKRRLADLAAGGL
jgi:hypothetical protein